MPSKKKIIEINSKRKPTHGFLAEDLHTASVQAIETIRKNNCIAKVNVKTVYAGCFLTSSISESNFNYSTSYKPSIDS